MPIYLINLNTSKLINNILILKQKLTYKLKNYKLNYNF